MRFPFNLVLGLVLLWFPLWVFRRKGARLSGFDQRAWPQGGHVPLAIIDIVRASLGAWLVLRAAPDLPRFHGMGIWQESAALGLALAIGLIIQTLSWKDEDFVFAPVPFLVGIVGPVMHPIVLAITFPLAIGSAIAVRAWAPGILAGAVGLAGVSMAVEAQDWRRALFVAAAVCLPVLVSLLAGRHLAWPRK